MAQPTGWAPAEPFIDLGELARDRQPERADGPIRAPRALTLVLVALLAVAGLMADGPPQRLSTLFTLTNEHSDFDVIGGVLYLFRGPNAPNAVAAYGLRDGRQLWRIQSPTGSSHDGVYQLAGRTLLVPNLCDADRPVNTVAVDTRTGRQVWRQPGVAAQPVAGGRLILIYRPGPTAGCGPEYPGIDAPPVQWAAVDAATGDVAWTMDVPSLTRISFDSNGESAARRAVLVAGDGTVTGRDLSTGMVTGQIAVPELALPPPGAVGTSHTAGAPELTVAGGRAIVTRHNDVGSDGTADVIDMTAYDVVTLARLWSGTVRSEPADRRPGDNYVGPSGCGPMLCLYGPAWTVFLDPRDGRERWRTELVMLTTEGDHALFADPRATGGELPWGGLAIRDVRTGRLLADLAGWRTLAGVRDDTGPPVLGFIAGNRTWFARLDLDRARLTVVGSSVGLFYACADEDGFLVCRRIDAAIRVWRNPGA
jgi:outer membrane protein assembly factor BamB